MDDRKPASRRITRNGCHDEPSPSSCLSDAGQLVIPICYSWSSNAHSIPDSIIIIITIPLWTLLASASVFGVHFSVKILIFIFGYGWCFLLGKTLYRSEITRSLYRVRSMFWTCLACYINKCIECLWCKKTWHSISDFLGCPYCKGGPTTTQRRRWYDPRSPNTKACEQSLLRTLFHWWWP